MATRPTLFRRASKRLTLMTALALVLGACSNDEDVAGGNNDGGSDSGTSEVASIFADRTADVEHVVAGPGGRIDIARDDLGIPHVYAASLDDASFAQGYMHARDRFMQMDLFRHNVMGRLSEYFPSSLGLQGTDFDSRIKMMTRDGRQIWDAIAESLEPPVRKVLEAYAAGVNVYIEEMRAGTRPFPPGYANGLTGHLTIEDVPDWTIEDTIAVSRLQQMQLSESSGEDISRGDIYKQNTPEMNADLIRYQPPDSTVILPDFYDLPDYQPPTSALYGPPPPSTPESRFASADFRRVLRHMEEDDLFGWERAMPRDIRGSNNWVIGPEHTESGHAMVFNDPHLFFAIPPLFYHSVLNTKHYTGGSELGGLAAGISFPGIPSMLIGHNEFVAWGATVVGWDVTDVYVEQVNPEGTAVMFNGSWVDILRVDIEVESYDAAPFTYTVEIVPHHGPILRDTKQDGTALSIRWTGHEVAFGGKAFMDAMQAKNIDEWMTAMEQFDVGAQSWNGADVDGNIGYAPFALVPHRTSVTGNCNPTMPVDGTGPCEWDGFLGPGEIPHAKNHPNGWVVTANNDVTGTLQDNDPTNDAQYLHSSRSDGFRARRITERIEELTASGGKISLADMQALQADTLSVEARRALPVLQAAATAAPALVTSLDLSAALDRLATWDFTTPSGVDAPYRTDGGPDQAEIDASIAAAIFMSFYSALRENVFLDEPGTFANGERELLYVLEHQGSLQTGLSLFDDKTTNAVVESPEEIILQSLRDGLDALGTKLGSDPNGWRWGAIHQVRTQDLFGQFGAAQRTLGPFPRGGARNTVDVATARPDADGMYIYGAGPQMRFYAVLDPVGIQSGSSLPGGQIDDPDSPHYDDLLQGWLRNEAFRYYLADDEVTEHLEELIVLRPE